MFHYLTLRFRKRHTIHWQPSPTNAGSTQASWLHAPPTHPKSHNTLKKTISTMLKMHKVFQQKT